VFGTACPMRKIAGVIIFVLGAQALSAGGLTKVIILPIINIEKDANFAYLESSITDSLKERLRAKLAFDELPEEKWALVAKQNYILADDFHTRTAAMNLGVLANQDIVIHGGFKPVNKKTAAGGVKTSILAIAHILDVKRKRTVSTIEIELPADSELFTSINQVADKLEQEARKVIPSKEDAARTGLQAEGGAFFSDWSIGLKAGAGIYVSGYAKYFSPQIPGIGANVKTHIAKFSDHLTTELGLFYMSHKLKEGSDSALQSLGASSTTSNYIITANFGYQMSVFSLFYVEPQIGGGYVLQTTTVTGSGINSSLSNGFPVARLGVTTGYRVNAVIDAILTTDCYGEFESGTITFVPTASLGVHYKFQ
jgi:hypothetical protein